jgi:8-oxo-dGTP pyrophosphatase MutT (NUDIX family)
MTPPGIQPELVAANGRRFAGSAAAVLVFLVDARRRFLLLRAPRRGARWEVVNGGLEAAETVLDAAKREVAEEAGPAVRHRMLGTVHAYTWRYDDGVTHMISTCWVSAYLDGEVQPGDDMAGSEVRWASIDEIEAMAAEGLALVPSEPWMFRRALQCFDLWVDEEPVDLEPEWVREEP